MALSKEERRMINTANKRLERLRKNNIEEGAYKMAPLQEDGKRRFIISGKSEKEKLQVLNRVEKFLSKETSTITGYQNLSDRRARIILGNEASEDKVNKFSLFLQSGKYSKLRKRYDSGQVEDFFNDIYEKGYNDEYIEKKFNEWIDSELNPFEVIERRKEIGNNK